MASKRPSYQTFALIVNTRSILVAFGWLLVTASAAVLGSALFFESNVNSALTSALPAGVLLALAGHLFTQAKTLGDAEEKRSAFNLQGFTKAFDHALSLLSDGSNNRAVWIEAARTLAHGEELAKSVVLAEHKRVLEVERLKYRGRFYRIIGDKPATFFYGVPPLYPTLDEAARASTAPTEQDGRAIVSSNHSLDEASIRMIWQAAGWPKTYEEPMGTGFTEEETNSLVLLFPKLHAYVEHTRTWASAAGKLFKREKNER